PPTAPIWAADPRVLPSPVLVGVAPPNHHRPGEGEGKGLHPQQDGKHQPSSCGGGPRHRPVCGPPGVSPPLLLRGDGEVPCPPGRPSTRRSGHGYRARGHGGDRPGPDPSLAGRGPPPGGLLLRGDGGDPVAAVRGGRHPRPVVGSGVGGPHRRRVHRPLLPPKTQPAHHAACRHGVVGCGFRGGIGRIPLSARLSAKVFPVFGVFVQITKLRGGGGPCLRVYLFTPTFLRFCFFGARARKKRLRGRGGGGDGDGGRRRPRGRRKPL
ncbi:uncharacterized protein BDZ83DRAFT_739895, partial [Colletotrichum acutatum]